jgi:hypothetical protein
MHRTVIIDGDTPVYTAATCCERAIPFSQPGMPVYDEDGNCLGVGTGGPVIYELDFEKGREHLDDIIENIRVTCKADDVVVALSNYDKPWRKALMPWYKANRHSMRRPGALRGLREHIHQKYRTFERPTLEGDDVCGILLTMPDPPFAGQRILASADKDMRTLPGLHYHMRSHFEFEVSPADADRSHMFQTLIGDTTDNYKGCPGIGEKKAEKLLEQGNNIKEWWELTKSAFIKAGVTVDYALLHAQVARICRHTDWDFNERKVILWQSPK